MDLSEEQKQADKLLEFTSVKKSAILHNLIESCPLHKSIDVAEDVYKDTCIEDWCDKLPHLAGSKLLIKKIIRNPVNDIELLLSRQKCYQRYNIDFTSLEEYEDDVLWIYKLDDELKDNNLVDILYPSTFIISYLNYIEPILECYHAYKIYYVPISAIVYPFMSMFAPLYYLNGYMKFNVSVKTYLNMLIKFVKMLFTFDHKCIKTNIIKVVTICAYMFLFAYNIYQTAEYSLMLYRIKSMINKKINNLNIFLKQATQIINAVPNNIVQNFVKIEPISITNGVKYTNLYTIWKDQSIKDNITKVLLNLYTIDIIHNVTNVSFLQNWCRAEYTNQTLIWNAKNPVLSPRQKANPINLSKNIIITGPNAAGKTTYVKSILSNVILSQTFGIANAIKANFVIYDTIVSLMRITDILGSRSYFETEAEYCRNMMNKAIDLSKNNKRGLFLMDEPMHSTPPTEGMSTAYAVAEFIGNLPNTSIILTTHFHKLTLLEANYPDTFINLSVEAIKQGNGFHFPYLIRPGFSYQCIAIDLLSSKEFPESVISSAINMKNKICDEIIR